MDGNIIDDLMNQIKQLEKQNESLKKTYLEKQNKLKASEENKDIIQENELKLEYTYIPKENTDSNSNIFFNFKDMDIDSGPGSENYKIKEMNISYVPFESHNKIYIMGDFTGWEPIEMQKVNNKLFSYNTTLLQGFQYFYCFTAQNEIIVDFNNEYGENHRNG